MNSLRFIQVLESYGADPQRWPASQRCAISAFCARFDDAQSLRQEAQALDSWLNLACAPEPSDLLKARILKRAEPLPQLSVSLWQALPLRAVAASLIAGVCIGMSSTYISAPQTVYLDANTQPSTSVTDSSETQTYAWLNETFTDEASQ